MVQSLTRRESPEQLLRQLKNENTRPSLLSRHKSDPLLTINPDVIGGKYEDHAVRTKSPSRRSISRERRTGSLERKCSLVRRKSVKEKSRKTAAESTDKSKTNNKNNTIKITEEHAESFSSCECEKQKSKTKSGKVKNGGKTVALFDAILENDFSSVRKLIITDEMNVDERNSDNTTGLHLASAAGNVEVLQLLIECGANINTVDTFLRTPLEYAVLYANFDCATVLIENGADTTLIQNGILHH